MYLLSPINDWSSTRLDGSCTCQICSLLGNKTPKPAQPNVVGMRTPTGPMRSLLRAGSLLCYSLSNSDDSLKLSDDYWQFSPYCLF